MFVNLVWKYSGFASVLLEKVHKKVTSKLLFDFGTRFGGFRAPKLSRARRISRIFPNSSIFRSGYLRAQEELEARPTCFLKLKTSSFELCKRDSRGVFAKIRKSSITTTTNRKISFHTPRITPIENHAKNSPAALIRIHLRFHEGSKQGGVLIKDLLVHCPDGQH